MPSIGPLESFVFPGVFTRTLLEPPTATAAGDLRYPAIIGVGQEEIRTEGFELVRGSSSIADNPIVGERADQNGQANVIDGANLEFFVKNFPIVEGDGKGTITENPSAVIVRVNGESVPVAKVEGATGLITLTTPPVEGDLVELNYFFKRRDTYVETDDVSVQADGSRVGFKLNTDRIVRGDNGGSTITNDDIGSTVTVYVGNQVLSVKVIQAFVNSVEVPIVSVDGANAIATLGTAPANGDVVTFNYFTNEWQNTFDILPAAEVTQIVKAGFDPSRIDFIEGRDYVLANGNEIHWGNSTSVEVGQVSDAPGVVPFGPEQITSTLIDNRIYKVLVGEGDGNKTSFALPFTPVKGDGLGTPIEDPSNGTAQGWDDVLAYVGADPQASLSASVISISGKNIQLRNAPAAGQKVYATFYYSRLLDDVWTFTNTNSGGDGVGTYTVKGVTYGTARQVKVGVGSTSTFTFLEQSKKDYTGGPSATSGTFINPSRTFLDEVITVDVQGDGSFTVSSSVPGHTGSGTVNTGYVGQTYVDSVTGFTLSLESATAGTIVFDVTEEFTVLNDFNKAIPGTRFFVSSTEGVALEDTATLKTLSLNSDEEPNVSDAYYVTFDQLKQDYSVKYFTSFQEVTRQFGPLISSNKIVVGANLAFLNGAQAVAIRQVPKAPGQQDATVQTYIEAIKDFDEPLENSTRPSLIQPLTTNDEVISFLKQSNAQQSSIRFKNERTSYFGYRNGTAPSVAINRASTLRTELLNSVYPDGGVMAIPDENGVEQEVLVGGEFLAVALAGRDVSPVGDIATPLTRAEIVGFRRLARRMDTVTASQVANAGNLVLENKFGSTRVLMALTTDTTSVVTRDPRIVEVKHFVQKGVRDVLDPFIGRKFIGNITGQVETTLNNYLAALQQANLIAAYRGVRAVQDPNDGTVINVEAFYSPVLPVNWIMVTLNLSSVID
jgi:hypothetical protein